MLPMDTEPDMEPPAHLTEC